MQCTPIDSILGQKKPGAKIQVKGWIRTKRDNKDFSFVEVNDGSCLRNLQLIVDTQVTGYENLISGGQTGATIFAEGSLVESQGGEQDLELRVCKIEVVGKVHPDYPLQKKRHSKEFLRSIPHLRPRTNLFGCVFRVRNQLTYSIHKFFQERGFVNLHTPIITTSDCEGAGKMFQVTGADFISELRKDPKAGYEKDFFGEPARLTVSGQLEAEAFALALGKVYTFGPTFRAENSNTTRHLSEFWMVEPEMSFFDLQDTVDLAESFIKGVIAGLLENAEDDMALFDKWVEKGILESLSALLKKPFVQMSYTEAIDLLQKSGEKFEFEPSWGVDLQTEHERFLADKHCCCGVFVTDYPKSIKPFYMRENEDGKTVAAVDLLLPRLGEIIGGSQREEREEVLRSRMEGMNVPLDSYDWYLDLRKYGSVVHSGFGLGFERLVMYCTGIENIRDVIPFPRTPGNA